MPPRLSAIVPTLGLSPWLQPGLEALRRDGGAELEILLVDQGVEACELPPGLVDEVLRLPTNRGFAIANNLAARRARGEFLATVNDDVVVEQGWCRMLLMELERRPRAAAVQGVNLRLVARPEKGASPDDIVDGCGIGWNRWWQAVQLGRGEPSPLAAAPREIFGVSATAAIYRRAALARIAEPELRLFDDRLGSYYEDVDLACRLRQAGFEAWLVPTARTRHAGSASGRQLVLGSTPRIYGNRYLVLARWLGRGFWTRLPRIWLRDAVDFVRAAAAGELHQTGAILAGWGRALRFLPRFLHTGPAFLPAWETRFRP